MIQRAWVVGISLVHKLWPVLCGQLSITADAVSYSSYLTFAVCALQIELLSLPPLYVAANFLQLLVGFTIARTLLWLLLRCRWFGLCC
jgi:hypothetical protein